ncbi:MAG: hypothetical protein DRQ51_08640 [Gammaproteobacteria bacterium]|nr:MAG: hypothetical protein DRQ51_08640 [Gammaproteobacteria bacterium]
MTNIDEIKIRISFITKIFFVLFGAIFLLLGKLVSLYERQQINEVFFIGLVCLVGPSFACINIYKKIDILSHKIGEL